MASSRAKEVENECAGAFPNAANPPFLENRCLFAAGTLALFFDKSMLDRALANLIS